MLNRRIFITTIATAIVLGSNAITKAKSTDPGALEPRKRTRHLWRRRGIAAMHQAGLGPRKFRSLKRFFF